MCPSRITTGQAYLYICPTRLCRCKGGQSDKIDQAHCKALPFQDNDRNSKWIKRSQYWNCLTSIPGHYIGLGHDTHKLTMEQDEGNMKW